MTRTRWARRKGNSEEEVPYRATLLSSHRGNPCAWLPERFFPARRGSQQGVARRRKRQEAPRAEPQTVGSAVVLAERCGIGRSGERPEERMSVEPMFVFSMPRSGSTLLQRMLASHTQVASASEPWVLLPLAAISGEAELRVYTEYSHRGTSIAIADLVASMPNGRDAYRSILHDTALRVYEEVNPAGARYFLDKTPRYFLIIDFILRLFPHAKAILLARNPLDVLASVITTWGNDRLWLHNALLDLYHGPLRLHEAALKHSDRLLRVSYEQLALQPEATCRNVCDYLDLSFEPEMLRATGSAALSGRMGDKSPNSTRTGVVADSIGRWREVLATPLRRWFAERYLGRLGPEVVRTCGVELAELNRELANLPVRWRHTAPDGFALAASFVATSSALAVSRDLWRRRGGLPIPKLD